MSHQMQKMPEFEPQKTLLFDVFRVKISDKTIGDGVPL